MSEPDTRLGTFHMRLDFTDLHLSCESVEIASVLVPELLVYCLMHETPGSVFR